MSLKDRIDAANELVSIFDLIDIPTATKPTQILCPVHDDTRKSARVYPDSNSVYCWTCGRSYDPVAILVETEGLSTLAAIEYIEKNAGVRWEKVDDGRDTSKFWDLVGKATADPDDPEHWSKRDVFLFRWAVHETVRKAVPSPDWSGFDDAHLDVRALRTWRDSQLDSCLRQS